MVEKININDLVNKDDLQLIISVNRKAIEIQTEVVDQNEEIISLLTKIKERQEKSDEKSNEKLDKLVKQSDDVVKDLFRVQVFFASGIISLIIQIIMLIKK